MTAATAYAPFAPARTYLDQPSDDSVVIDLVASARGGDIQAWDALLERYTPLIWSICRKYRLRRDGADHRPPNLLPRPVGQLRKTPPPAPPPRRPATNPRPDGAP